MGEGMDSWDRLPRWVRPPRHGDAARDRRARLSWISLVVIALAMGAYLAVMAWRGHPLVHSPGPWLVLGLAFAGLTFCRFGHERVAGYLVPTSLLGAALYTVSLGGPATTTTLVFSVPLMILAASLLIGARGAIGFGIGGLLVGGVHFYGASQGWFPAEGPVRTVVSHGAAFAATTVLLSLFAAAAARGVELALASERQSRRDLGDAHEALAARAARGEALAALGRDIAEGMETRALLERGVDVVATLLDAADVVWAERGAEVDAWTAIAVSGDRRRARLESATLDTALRGGAPFASSRDGGAPRELAATGPTDGGVAGLLVTFTPGDQPTSEDEELVESVVHLLGTAIRHRRASEALTARQRDLAEIVERSPDAILTVGPDGVVAMANPAATILFGRETRDIVGRTLEQLGFDPSQEDAGQDDDSRPLTSTLTTFRVRRPDGEERESEVNLRTVDVPGQGRCLQLVVRDITPRRRAQRERKELSARLAAAQRMEALGKLAGGVAHDFNNLLTILMNLRELLTSEPLTSSARELVDDMGDLADRAAALTRQLLTFARKQPGRPEELDVADVVHGLRPLLSRLVGDAIELEIDAERDAFVRIDPSQLEQVVMNLAVNARDAMPSGGALTLRVHHTKRASHAGSVSESHVEQSRDVVLEVRDTGVGMDAETAARIFEPFFTTKGQDKGTGLGLSTVHGIVRRAGGDITVDSAPGRGTRFELLFPVADPPGHVATAPKTSDSGSQRKPVAVLLVDDEPLVRRSFARALRRASMRVVECGTAAEALRALRDDPSIGLILSDVSLPDSDGPALVHAALDARPDLVVVYTSGHGPATLGELGIREGRDHIVAKPFVPEEMIEVVRSALRGRPVTPLRRGRRASGRR
ncbi:MAG: ATP-binding protein [Sandaracinaceae bacterium]